MIPLNQDWQTTFVHDGQYNAILVKIMKQYLMKSDGAKLRITDTQVKWKYNHLVNDLVKGIVCHFRFIY